MTWADTKKPADAGDVAEPVDIGRPRRTASTSARSSSARIQIREAKLPRHRAVAGDAVEARIGCPPDLPRGLDEHADLVRAANRDRLVGLYLLDAAEPALGPRGLHDDRDGCSEMGRVVRRISRAASDVAFDDDDEIGTRREHAIAVEEPLPDRLRVVVAGKRPLTHNLNDAIEQIDVRRG